MEKTTLSQTTLFCGLDENEITVALKYLDAQMKRFAKGEGILYAGETTGCMGLVLKGSVTIESNDVWGNRTILGHVGAGGFFAEAYAYLASEILLVDVYANEDCEILSLRTGILADLPAAASTWQVRLLSNLLRISAQKNLHLSERSFHTAPKSVRARIMAYLNTLSLQTHKKDLEIPFDRQQMADYLNVERTALSKELGRMRREGLIDFRKNHFSIK